MKLEFLNLLNFLKVLLKFQNSSKTLVTTAGVSRTKEPDETYLSSG